MSERTYWIRGLPPPDDPLGVVLTLIGGAIGIFLLWVLVNVLVCVLSFVFRPVIDWLNKPL